MIHLFIVKYAYRHKMLKIKLALYLIVKTIRKYYISENIVLV